MTHRPLVAAALALTCVLSGCADDPKRTAVPVVTGGVASVPADWSRVSGFEVLTQYSPSSTFVGQATDLARIAESFTGILLASGKLGASREQAVQLASALRLHVWLDVDLTDPFAAGERITGELEQLAAFAQRHRDTVVGIKLANELGQEAPYADDPKLLEAYLRQIGTVLHSAAPGLPVTVDLPVPEAACAPGSPGLSAAGGSSACRSRIRARFPALEQVNIDHYLSLGVLDGVFISPYLHADEAYTATGTDTADVLGFAYRWLTQRPWAGSVRIFSRKALAFPDASYPGSEQDAGLAVKRHLRVPLIEGLAGADIWAWRRPFRGQLRTLMDKDGSANPLWDGLKSFRAALPNQSSGTAAERRPRPRVGSAGTA